jgi:plastocyanin
MRRAWPAAGLVLALAAAGPVMAHPGHNAVPVTVQDTSTYAPDPVTTVVDKGVVWRWEEGVLVTNHSVTSDGGGPEAFDSGSRSSGTFEHIFRRPGIYDYHCTVVDEMTGTVEVKPLPGRAPRVRRLRVRSGEKPVARFRASKSGDLVGRIAIRRSGEWVTKRAFSRYAPKGRNRFKLRTHGLDAGRYRLELTLYDRQARKGRAKDRFRLTP